MEEHETKYIFRKIDGVINNLNSEINARKSHVERNSNTLDVGVLTLLKKISDAQSSLLSDIKVIRKNINFLFDSSYINVTDIRDVIVQVEEDWITIQKDLNDLRRHAATIYLNSKSK